MAPPEWFTTSNVPESENMWPLLESSPLAGQPLQEENQIRRLVVDPAWSAEQVKLAKDILNSNKERMNLFEALAKKKGIQAPPFQAGIWDENESQRKLLWDLVPIAALSAQLAQSEGDAQRWLSRCRQMLEVGRVVGGHPVDLWQMTGNRMMTESYKLLLRAKTPEQRRAAAEVAEEFEPQSPIRATVRTAAQQAAWPLHEYAAKPKTPQAGHPQVALAIARAAERHPRAFNPKRAMAASVEALKAISDLPAVPPGSSNPLIARLKDLRGPLPVWLDPVSSTAPAPGPEKVEELRQAMAKMENPLGRLAASAVLESAIVPSESDRTPRAYRAAMIAIAKGIPASPPIDPFSGRPMKIDPKRKIMWSVGRNKVDDGGKGEPGRVGGADVDIVFTLPER